jgi:hypothetical protein
VRYAGTGIAFDVLFEKSLTVENLTRWLGNLSTRNVQLSMPRFRAESEFSLGRVLSTMDVSEQGTEAAATGLAVRSLAHARTDRCLPRRSPGHFLNSRHENRSPPLHRPSDEAAATGRRRRLSSESFDISDIARVCLAPPGFLRVGLQPSAKQTRLRIRISAGVQLLRLSQNTAQVLGGELRVLVHEVHAHRLAVYDRKRMA